MPFQAWKDFRYGKRQSIHHTPLGTTGQDLEAIALHASESRTWAQNYHKCQLCGNKSSSLYCKCAEIAAWKDASCTRRSDWPDGGASRTGSRPSEDWMVDVVVVNGSGRPQSGQKILRSDVDEWGATQDPQAARTLHTFIHDSQQLERRPLQRYLMRACAPLLKFFNPKFEKELENQEREFQNASWFNSKQLAIYASIYLVANGAFYLVVNRHASSLYEKIVYFGGLTLVTLPVPLMVVTDMPNLYPVLFQLWFAVATWYCAFVEVIEVKRCHFLEPGSKDCHGKDFLAFAYYATALPTMMMFILLKRWYNFIAQVLYLTFVAVVFTPSKPLTLRYAFSFVIFSVFSQALHYARETGERRSFLMHHQLKEAYKTQFRAQMAEHKAGDAKRRFASYIFHEVRVPLNTALLAYQNLTGSGTKIDEIGQRECLDAIESSLVTMRQVLDDGLDLEKMDAGHFEVVPRPFPLHRTIRSILKDVSVLTGSKGLQLEIQLDDQIDSQLRSTSVFSDDARQEKDGSAAVVGETWVLGDPVRLRQIVSNLACNAVKFTPQHSGPIKVSTKLLAASSDPGTRSKTLSFRLEVQDSGPGVNPVDLEEGRLFQPFGQTRVGKMAGTGSGLGLAIVRQIVALSGGRLGVRSKKGQGANFWIEMSYPVCSALVEPSGDALHSTLSSASIPEHLFHLKSDVVSASPITAPTIMERRSGVSSPTISLPKPELHEILLKVAETPGSKASSTVSGSTLATTTISPLAELPGGPPLVLVVDDDELTRRLMARMLTTLGCVVDTASDGRECLDMVLGSTSTGSAPKRYDMVSLDNQMPVMTGVEAVRRLRLAESTVYVLGCTGNALSDDQAEYLQAGVDSLLTKPIRKDDLKAAIVAAVERRRSTSTSLHPIPP